MIKSRHQASKITIISCAKTTSEIDPLFEFRSYRSPRKIMRHIPDNVFRPGKFCAIKMRRLSKNPRKNPYRLYDRRGIIYIHIPKTAGMSIAHAVYSHDEHDPIVFRVGHHSIEYIKTLCPKKFNEHYKFTFVRNPFDRLVSAFLYIQHYSTFPRDIDFRTEHLAKYKTFDEFVLALQDAAVRQNILMHNHFRPQLDFIVDKYGYIRLDFIGRYERLHHDMRKLSKQIDRPLLLPHFNPGARARYQRYYTDKLVDIVHEIYRSDIQCLNYKIDL